MRSSRLIGLVAALVIVGFVAKRQLSAVRVPQPRARVITADDHDPSRSCANNRQLVVTEAVEDALDDVMRVHEQRLRATSGD